ncbi:hypothetical protein WJX77_000086 [Trebouxia sp. C0004]
MANPLHLPSSRLSEQQSVVEDLLDDDFTPEELSLVQQMLPPERFLRVLSALREAVGRRSCPSKDYYADSFTTPVQQVQPQGLLTQGNPSTSWGQGQAISPWTDRHESYSSDDEGVLTPPRQVATAAEQFQNRLGHVAKPYSRTWSSDDEDECVSSAADAAEEEGAAVAAVAGRLQSVQQGLASAEGRLAELTGRRPVKRQLEAAEVEDRAADSAMQEGSDATLSEPCGIADIIRRFDSGSAWGSLLHSPKSQSHSMQSLRSQGKSQLSPQRAKDSPRICALRPGQHECHEHAQTGKKAALLPGRDERWDDESALAARQAANVDIPLVKDSSSLEPQHAALGGQRSQSKGNSALPQLKGQGSLVMPQLRGQGSSMRGDQWLPQQWLEPDEQLPEVEAAAASPRDRMHAAMEAVRAAERAVKAAAVLSPRRQG